MPHLAEISCLGCRYYRRATRAVSALDPLTLRSPSRQHLRGKLGGTISGEHGVGVAKNALLPEFACYTQVRVLKQLRQVFDPNGILNPGKLFD